MVDAGASEAYRNEAYLMNRHASMNRAYRLIWSAVRSVWIPVAEKTRGRKQAGRTLVATAMSLGAAFAQAGGVSGGQVIAGSGSIVQSAALTTITQQTPKLTLTWSSFNIAPQQTVDFVQPSVNAIAVNRILDTNGTQILGHLNANGQVFLINPNGMLFGPGAQVNVGGLLATTLNLKESSLEGKVRTFSGNSAASVVNEGRITAEPGGYVALLAGHVDNRGTISAQLGTVALAAGDAATLTFSNNNLVRVQVDQSVLRSVAENGGVIRADGGQVIMTAGASDALLASVVNNTGVIEARTVSSGQGRITLLAGSAAGIVDVAGALDASAPNGGNGGFIETSAAHVEIANTTRITTAAAMGLYGSWLIDPHDFTIAATGGNMSGAALSSELGTTSVLVESSASLTLGLGNINVNDAVAWGANTVLALTASNNVSVKANITATGNTAGLVISPNTANGADAASGGTYTLQGGASITLSGTSPSLSISGNVYSVINTLGAEGSTSGTDLQGINGALGGHYALGSNIDALATSAWNAGAGFMPIGTAATPFSGSFDGLGHTINNLTINRPSTSYVGLIGVAGGSSVIENVAMVGGSVSGGAYGVGGLVGRNFGSIADSSTTGSVTGSVAGSFYGEYGVGGLVGDNLGSITRSHATGVITGLNAIGGLVGDSSGPISSSYAIGAVSGNQYVGGLVGNFRGSGNDLYATGPVSGYGRVGGLVGNNVGSLSNSHAAGSVGGSNYVGGLIGVDYGTVSNTYATGAVRGGTHVGGLIGFIDQGALFDSYASGAASGAGAIGGLVGGGYQGTVTDSYWNITTSGQTNSDGGTGLTTAQTQTASNFMGFVFTNTPGAVGNNWVMVDSDGSLNNAGSTVGATLPMLASEYSSTISNAHQLQLMAMAPAQSYTLGANVDAAGTAPIGGVSSDVWGPSGFAPIGSLATPFTGTFDGLGHTVSVTSAKFGGRRHWDDHRPDDDEGKFCFGNHCQHSGQPCVGLHKYLGDL